MLNWIKIGVFIVVGILIAGFFIGCLEAIRYKVNKNSKELPSAARWVLGVLITLYVASLAVSSNPIQMVWNGIFIVLGTIWGNNRSFKGNLGGPLAALAAFFLCAPTAISIAWDNIAAMYTTGNVDRGQMLWFIGPVAALAILIVPASIKAGKIEKKSGEDKPKDEGKDKSEPKPEDEPKDKSESKDKDEDKEGAIWLGIAAVLTAITGIVGYFMWKGGMFA